MENLQSLENTTDDLKKQVWNLIKNVIPKLEAKIENSSGGTDDNSALETKLNQLENQLNQLKNTTLPELENQIASKDTDTLQNQISVLQSQTNDLINTAIPDIENKVSNITNTLVPEIKNQINEIENTSAQIENDISEITDTIIPELEDMIENSQGSASGGETWTTVYDKTSTDSAINWGYPAGITASKGLISTSIDFTPYKFIRVYYTKGTYSIYRDFNIEEVRNATSYIPYFVVTLFDSGVLVLTGQAIGLKYDATTGVRQFYIGRGRSWNLKTNAYNTSTDLSSDTNCFVYKIQVRN